MQLLSTPLKTGLFGILLSTAVITSAASLAQNAPAAKTAPATPAKVASKVTPQKNIATSSVQGLLYQLTLPAPAPSKGKAAAKPIQAHLFATIHIADKDLYPLSAKIENAFKQANTLAVETDTRDETAVKSSVAKLSYNEPDKLENHLTPDTWNTLKKLTGESVEKFQIYKPVMVAMGLTVTASMQLGYDPALGLEQHFLNAAVANKKRIESLESIEFQGTALASLSDAENDALLARTLQSFQTGEVGSEFDRIKKTWKNADADTLAAIFVFANQRDIGSQQIAKVLMSDRNEEIANKIISLMQTKNTKLFATLGAGHFAGDKDILSLLRQKGVQIQQIH